MALIFSPRTDILLRQAGLGALLAGGLFAGGWYYYALPSYTRVGYAPDQPVPFSHHQHVTQLGMDCRYCHTHVTESPHSNVPTAQTCMNCHQYVKANSPLLSQVRESYANNTPVRWKRIHKVPDYAYFNHAVHVNRGVSCVSCHSNVNEMGAVGTDAYPIHHARELSMGWCLNCHREPEPHLRPNSQVTNLTWKPEDEGVTAGTGRPKTAVDVGAAIKEQYGVNPPQTCQGCHR